MAVTLETPTECPSAILLRTQLPHKLMASYEYATDSAQLH